MSRSPEISFGITLKWDRPHFQEGHLSVMAVTGHWELLKAKLMIEERPSVNKLALVPSVPQTYKQLISYILSIGNGTVCQYLEHLSESYFAFAH